MFFSIVQAFPGTMEWPDDLHGIEATANLICHLVDFVMCPCNTQNMAWQKKTECCMGKLSTNINIVFINTILNLSNYQYITWASINVILKTMYSENMMI